MNWKLILNSLAILAIFSSCGQKTILERLSPESREYLEDQAKIQCKCLAENPDIVETLEQLYPRIEQLQENPEDGAMSLLMTSFMGSFTKYSFCVLGGFNMSDMMKNAEKAEKVNNEIASYVGDRSTSEEEREAAAEPMLQLLRKECPEIADTYTKLQEFSEEVVNKQKKGGLGF